MIEIIIFIISLYALGGFVAYSMKLLIGYVLDKPISIRIRVRD